MMASKNLGNHGDRQRDSEASTALVALVGKTKQDASPSASFQAHTMHERARRVILFCRTLVPLFGELQREKAKRSCKMDENEADGRVEEPEDRRCFPRGSSKRRTQGLP
ncbi:hypothetical protein MRX96_003854 [Rhipicephalus microplus]